MPDAVIRGVGLGRGSGHDGPQLKGTEGKQSQVSFSQLEIETLAPPVDVQLYAEGNNLIRDLGHSPLETLKLLQTVERQTPGDDL